LPYLTETELSKVMPVGLDPNIKADYIEKAETILDNITRHFYVFNDLVTDVPFRRNQFKKALLAQIAYFVSIGTTDFDEIFNEPDSFSIGRTSITNSSSKEGGNSRSYVAFDVELILAGTGLLFRGEPSWD